MRVKVNAETIIQTYNRTITTGTESSVPLASVRGMEHHHPSMSRPGGHGGLPILIRRKYIFYNNDIYIYNF